jgi:hypothetical protein
MSDAYCASQPGAGVPAWDPFYGIDRNSVHGDDYWRLADNSFSNLVADGRVRPTGLERDPRLPPAEPGPQPDILQLLRAAAARYEASVEAQLAKMIAEHAAMKKGSWADRIKSSQALAPTRADAMAFLARRSGDVERPWDHHYYRRRAGLWRPWEVEEVAKEEWRQAESARLYHESEARCDAIMKSIYPTWGGGT